MSISIEVLSQLTEKEVVLAQFGKTYFNQYLNVLLIYVLYNAI